MKGEIPNLIRQRICKEYLNTYGMHIMPQDVQELHYTLAVFPKSERGRVNYIEFTNDRDKKRYVMQRLNAGEYCIGTTGRA